MHAYICVWGQAVVVKQKGEHFVYSMKKTFSLKLGKNVGGFFYQNWKKIWEACFLMELGKNMWEARQSTIKPALT